MADFFCGVKLGGNRLGYLENRPGQYSKFYFARELFTDGDINGRRNFLAAVDFDSVVCPGTAVDGGDNGLYLSADLGFGVDTEWGVDPRAFGSLGGVPV